MIQPSCPVSPITVVTILAEAKEPLYRSDIARLLPDYMHWKTLESGLRWMECKGWLRRNEIGAYFTTPEGEAFMSDLNVTQGEASRQMARNTSKLVASVPGRSEIVQIISDAYTDERKRRVELEEAFKHAQARIGAQDLEIASLKAERDSLLEQLTRPQEPALSHDELEAAKRTGLFPWLGGAAAG